MVLYLRIKNYNEIIFDNIPLGPFRAPHWKTFPCFTFVSLSLIFDAEIYLHYFFQYMELIAILGSSLNLFDMISGTKEFNLSGRSLLYMGQNTRVDKLKLDDLRSVVLSHTINICIFT